MPINHCAYWRSCLTTMPINRHAYQPSCLSAIWSSFATLSLLACSIKCNLWNWIFSEKVLFHEASINHNEPTLFVVTIFYQFISYNLGLRLLSNIFNFKLEKKFPFLKNICIKILDAINAMACSISIFNFWNTIT